VHIHYINYYKKLQKIKIYKIIFLKTELFLNPVLSRLFLKAANIKNNLNSERLFLNPVLARLFLKAAT